MANQLELRNRFIRDVFGRYLSDDVVESILDSPEASSSVASCAR